MRYAAVLVAAFASMVTCSEGSGPWAQAGWEVDDRLDLLRVGWWSSGGGVVFEILRSNHRLADAGIDALEVEGKTHGSRCVVSRLVLYPPAVEASDPGTCGYYEAFGDDLRSTGLIDSIPGECVP